MTIFTIIMKFQQYIFHLGTALSCIVSVMLYCILSTLSAKPGNPNLWMMYLLFAGFGFGGPICIIVCVQQHCAKKRADKAKASTQGVNNSTTNTSSQPAAGRSKGTQSKAGKSAQL